MNNGIQTTDKLGRPAIYTEELGISLCEKIASGMSLRKACQEEGMPSISTVIRWLHDPDKESFWTQYAHARIVQAENMFDELLEIADDGTNDFMEIEGKDGFSITVKNREAFERSRLRVDTRKFYLSKVLPKKFGDKVDPSGDPRGIKGNRIEFIDSKKK